MDAQIDNKSLNLPNFAIHNPKLHSNYYHCKIKILHRVFQIPNIKNKEKKLKLLDFFSVLI